MTTPQPGTYQIDPTHSSIEIIARHLMTTKVRGAFGDFSGEIIVGETPDDSSVSVEIQTASINTNTEDRDNHLRSPDFLHVEEHPTASFQSTGVEDKGNGEYVLNGDLTLAGVTKPIAIDFTFAGMATDPWGNARALFSGSTEIEREEFGLTWNQILEGGGLLVSKKLKVELEVQGVLSSVEASVDASVEANA